MKEILDEKYFKWYNKTVKQCKSCGNSCILDNVKKGKKDETIAKTHSNFRAR